MLAQIFQLDAQASGADPLDAWLSAWRALGLSRHRDWLVAVVALGTGAGVATAACSGADVGARAWALVPALNVGVLLGGLDGVVIVILCAPIASLGFFTIFAIADAHARTREVPGDGGE